MKNKEMVEVILRDYPQTRENDVTLAVYVWWKFYRYFLEWEGDASTEGDPQKGRWIVPLEKVPHLPSESDLSRIRRKFNELGLYKATDPAVIARRSRERKVRGTINTSEWGEHL
jgi:hypothetical protein